MNETYDLYDLNKNKKNIEEILYLTDTYNIYSNFYANNLNNLNTYKFLIEINFSNNRNLNDDSISHLHNLEKVVLPKNKLISNKSISNFNKIKY